MSQVEFRVDDSAIAEAEAALAALAEEYPGYAQADVDDMVRLSREILAGAESGADNAARLSELYGIAHNVKGQGASFGYDLMTIFGEALCAQLRHATAVDVPGARRAMALVGACATVLAERLTGLGGVLGSRLLADTGLSAA